jgi:hypothetical protein
MLFLISLLNLSNPGPNWLSRPGLLLLPCKPQQQIAISYQGNRNAFGGTMYHAGMVGTHYWMSGQIGYHAYRNRAIGSGSKGQLYQAEVQLAYRYRNQPEHDMLRSFWTAGFQVSSFNAQSEGLQYWRISGNQYMPYLATGIALQKGVFSLQLALKGGISRVWAAELKQLNPDYEFSDFGFTPGNWQPLISPSLAVFVGKNRVRGFFGSSAQTTVTAWQGPYHHFGILWKPAAANP